MGLKRLVMGAVLAAMIGCTTKYECDGVPVLRATDGKLEATAAERYNDIGSEVKNYEKEIADVINETWKKEFKQPIDKNICAVYVTDIPGTAAGHYIVENDVSYHGLEETIHKTVKIENNLEPSLSTFIFTHELAHQFSLREALPELVGHRINTMATIHFPKFGKDTNYKSFSIAHSHLFYRSSYAVHFEADSNTLGSLAALIALNRHQGHFPSAHQALSASESSYLNAAKQFVEHAKDKDDVQVIIVNDKGEENSSYQTYGGISLHDLRNVVAHQIIKTNVGLNSEYTDDQKIIATRCMKKAAQFPMHTNIATDGVGPILVNSNHTYYKEGFKNPFIFYPQDYDYSIPKGNF